MKKWLIGLAILGVCGLAIAKTPVSIIDAGGKGLAVDEDSAHVSADPGIPAMAVRADTAAALSGTTGDYEPLIVDSNGKLHVNGREALSATSLIAKTTLDDSPTSVSSSWTDILEYTMLGVWIDYDETEDGAEVSAAVSVDVSVDGTQSLDGKFYDVAGGTTLQTSETISADGDYIFWLPLEQDAGWTVPYFQVDVAATNTNATCTANITATYWGIK